jgi:hypothetical protein
MRVQFQGLDYADHVLYELIKPDPSSHLLQVRR